MDQHFTIGTMLDRNAMFHPDRIAVRFEERAYSYADLRDRARRLASALQAHGVAPGDRVGVLMHNNLEWFEVYFACQYLGLVVVPLNVLLHPHELQPLVEEVGLRAVVVDTAGLEVHRAAGSPGDVLVVAVGEGDGATVGYHDALACARPLDATHAEGSAVGALSCSSGTTGAPKAAIWTNDAMLINAVHQIADTGIRRDDVHLVVPSLSWAAGLGSMTLATLCAGAEVVVMPSGGLTVDRLVSALVRTGATRAVVVPTLVRQLAADAALQATLRTSRFRVGVVGGEPIPAADVDAIGEAVPTVSFLQAYGLSEGPTITSLLEQEYAAAKSGSVGRPTAVAQLAVRTEDGIRSAGHGELLIRSPARLRGYWNRPAESAAALRDGWLNTGDLAAIDDEGFASIVGRTKDMIISGGLNIYPAEIESVLAQLPAVIESAVVGRPDPRWGERPVAVVVAGRVSADEITRHCRDRLPGYKVPDEVVFTETLPRTASGKLKKAEVRRVLLAEEGP